MSETVNLPALGESVTEGTVTRWLKAVGDEVAVDEPLVEVSTDKVDTEIPSPVAGVLEEILVEEDDTVEVGAPLATIGDGSGGGSADASEDDAAAEEPAVEEAQQDDAQQEPAGEPAPEERASTDQGSDEAPSAGGEASEVTLPALGESVTEGTVTRWLKSVGDEVEVDEPLLEVSTDKVDTEIPSPVAGTLLEIRAEEDDTVEVGAVLALVGSGSAGGGSAPSEGSSGQDEASAEEIEDKATEAEAPEETEEAAEAAGAEKSEETPEASPSEEASRRESAERDSAQGESAEAPSATEPGQGYVTPLVRRLAHQNNVDLSTVRGTGVGGRIRKQDVLAAALASQAAAGGSEAPAEQASEAAAPSSAPAAASAPAASSSVDPSVRGEVEKAPRIRQVIAQRMRESLDLSTQLTQVHEVDVTRIVQLRKKAKASFQQQAGVNLTYLPFITKAVAEALKQHPKLNASFSEDNKEITYHASEDIAIAVDTEKGLLVPVIKDAGSLNLTGLAQKIADVAERTRTNKISPDELSGGTFSITNIGSVGALFDTPIINQPQVAILGTGAIVKRPMVVTDADGNDSIAIRHMMYLSLTYDHRLVDGADAGRFLTTLRQRLEGGEFANELGL
ncbi:2-oxoglutarate dehydrogenase, E2 component, dihydrolipoamide succinyltransferase [Micrococcus yunnanensis]|uniref:2-oxoglutarate dehydrogenase, E2 component, dihydrolipoamide succinyltransferase n=1 Tax=Micrococcus yunnanensis TaxID=566027 RepID=UPI00178B1C16|nr:2-oxoglutarate dehydrogenase, E2 component, dihydrolipoamide succinyltransferase [Micrococcus yunnanensis]MBE1539038.1 2-oxoglutarate dehydrogenase E2 component (dihydrolipoamide succinyltransferase) [Micrococcus yunnanensis]